MVFTGVISVCTSPSRVIPSAIGSNIEEREARASLHVLTLFPGVARERRPTMRKLIAYVMQGWRSLSAVESVAEQPTSRNSPFRDAGLSERLAA